MKRFFDFTVSLLMLLLLSPFLLVLFLLSLIFIGSPVFFVQPRGGYKGEVFHLIKFRSMKDLFDEDGNPLPDEVRLVSWGKFLRKTSLDELPTLINILKGDMSLVGPRPLLSEYLPLYSKGQARRHDVRPGLTGWAQVNGRNALSWEEKFDLDVWYVDHRRFALDVKILFLTVLKVLRSEGINQEGQATAEKFKGSQ